MLAALMEGTHQRIARLIRGAKRVQRLSNGNDPRSGPYRAFHDVFEEGRGASIRRRGVADVVRREDQPSTRSAVSFNQVLDRVAIVPGFLEEVRAQVIDIGLSDIEGLSSASSACEVFGHHPFRARPRRTDRKRESSERSAWNEFVQSGLVLEDGALELLRLGIPGMAMGERMTAELVTACHERAHVFRNKHRTGRGRLTHQAQRGVIGSPQPESLENGAAGEQGGSRKVVKSK